MIKSKRIMCNFLIKIILLIFYTEKYINNYIIKYNQIICKKTINEQQIIYSIKYKYTYNNNCTEVV